MFKPNVGSALSDNWDYVKEVRSESALLVLFVESECFSVALFSALEHLAFLWHCSLLLSNSTALLSHVILNEWLWSFLVQFWASVKVCTYSAVWLLHAWRHVKLLPSWYTCAYRKPCTSLQCHFVQSYIHRVQVCLAVIWYLCFWKNDWDLSCATMVTQGWNGSRTKSGHRKLTLEKKILLQLLPALTPKTFQSWVWHSTTELSPLSITVSLQLSKRQSSTRN